MGGSSPNPDYLFFWNVVFFCVFLWCFFCWTCFQNPWMSLAFYVWKFIYTALPAQGLTRWFSCFHLVLFLQIALFVPGRGCQPPGRVPHKILTLFPPARPLPPSLLWTPARPAIMPHPPLHNEQSPSKHETFRQFCFNAGPASQTLAQHWSSIGSMSCADGFVIQIKSNRNF